MIGKEPACAEGIEYRPPAVQWLWIAIVIALGVRIFFWVWTDRIWEDCLITVRHAENAAAGLGLTHQPQQGSPLHGFTSPLSVLIPLVGQLIYPNGGGFLILRLASLVACAISLFAAWRIGTHPAVRLSTVPMLFWLGYLALEHHQILFGMSGMETQIVVAITLLTLWAAVANRIVPLGIMCGLALWGRPDGVVIVTLAVVTLACSRRIGDALKTGMIATAVFLPWLVFTTVYYGTPVPHTITAKDIAYTDTFEAADSFGERLQMATAAYVNRADNLRLWLAPSFGGMGGGTINFLHGARPIQAITIALAIVGTIVLLLRPAEARLLPIFAVGFFGFLIVLVPVVAGWYLPPWLAVVMLLVAVGLQWLMEARRPSRLRRGLAITAACGLLALYVIALTRTFPVERIIQQDIEDAVRMKTGLWLQENMRDDDWISCECLGYPGYYCNHKVLDFPGLGSRRSVDILRGIPASERGMSALFDAARPEWLAVRPHEWTAFQTKYPDAAAEYVERISFRADPEQIAKAANWLWLPDGDVFRDREFIIFQRRTDPTTSVIN